MILCPIVTPLLRPGDNLAAILTQPSFVSAQDKFQAALEKNNDDAMRPSMAAGRSPMTTDGDGMAGEACIQPGDILVISSKAVATVEGARIDLTKLTVSDEARAWSAKTGQALEFCEAIMKECIRLNGTIIRAVPHALMTRLHPHGMEGSLLVPNAGLDQSNVEHGMCIGWPRDPVESGRRLRKELETLIKLRMANGELQFATGNSQFAVIITDSCLRPGRSGVTAIALTVSGIAPLRSEKGTKDLFNKTLILTEEAVADQLATAANILMGNAAQSTPAVLIRDHGIAFESWDGWVPGMRPEEDIFPAIG